MANIKLYDPATLPAAPGVIRNTTRRNRVYLPEARAAANAVAVVLVGKYGQVAWIMQAMTAVMEATQNCIEQLSGQAAPESSLPLGDGGQYNFPARTAQELQASAAQAAHVGNVSAARDAQVQHAQDADIALANGEVDMFAVLQQAAGVQDPASQGMPATEVPSEPGSDNWLL